jgi:hypothetical protein
MNNGQKNTLRPGIVGHACNPSTQEAEAKVSEFWASLGYVLSSRSAKAA